MIIYGACKSCKNQLLIDSNVETRLDLIKAESSYIERSCSRCGVTNTFEINQVKARLSKSVIRALIEVGGIGLIVCLVSILLLDELAEMMLAIGLYAIPALAYIWSMRKNFNAMEVFNKSEV